MTVGNFVAWVFAFGSASLSFGAICEAAAGNGTMAAWSVVVGLGLAHACGGVIADEHKRER